MKKIIEYLEQHVRRTHISHERALDIFLDFLIDLFDYKYYQGDWAQHIRDLNQDNPEMMLAAIEWANETGREIDKRGWYDSLGHLYEMMYQSKGKASALGQFYTPDNLCDLLSKVSCEKRQDRILDCACGSGRTLLAAFGQIKKGYYVGEDIDSMSVRMCALNLMIHGMRGRVVCHDTLKDPVHFDWGYEINEVRYPFPTPFYSVRRITNPKPIQKEPVSEKAVKKKVEQLSLF